MKYVIFISDANIILMIVMIMMFVLMMDVIRIPDVGIMLLIMMIIMPDDSCDASSGVSHNWIICDDYNACTNDYCDQNTGCET